MPQYLPTAAAVPSASASNADPLPPGEGMTQQHVTHQSDGTASQQTAGSEGGDSDAQTLEAANAESAGADGGKGGSRGDGVSGQQSKPAPRRQVLVTLQALVVPSDLLRLHLHYMQAPAFQWKPPAFCCQLHELNSVKSIKKRPCTRGFPHGQKDGDAALWRVGARMRDCAWPYKQMLVVG